MSVLAKVLVLALAAAGASAVPTSSYTSAAPPPPPAPTADTKALFVDLFTSPSAIGRFQRLLTDGAGALLGPDALKKAVVFDYAATAAGDSAGKISAATQATYPILVGQDIATVVAFLGPCSLLVPHTHPEPESLVVTEGSLIVGQLIPGLVGPGQGTGEIVETLSTYQGELLPAGSIHYQLNPTCKPATFVSSLPSSDPGTTLESTFFSIDGKVVSAALGFPDGAVDGRDIDAWRAQIPASLFVGVETCLKACGISKRSIEA